MPLLNKNLSQSIPAFITGSLITSPLLSSLYTRPLSYQTDITAIAATAFRTISLPLRPTPYYAYIPTTKTITKILSVYDLTH
jgi:hypothetical protein